MAVVPQTTSFQSRLINKDKKTTDTPFQTLNGLYTVEDECRYLCLLKRLVSKQL